MIFLSTPSARRATRARRPHADRHRISIHALREEGDMVMSPVTFVSPNFYPRPPRGGRPGGRMAVDIRTEFLSTPSARRATAPSSRRRPRMRNFYPRPPRGGRPERRKRAAPLQRFLSTPSARRATGCPPSTTPPSSNFYPRPPRGGRQQKQRQNLYFQTNYTTFCTNLEEP